MARPWLGQTWSIMKMLLILFILLVRSSQTYFMIVTVTTVTYSQLEPGRASTNKAIYLSVSLAHPP